MKKTVMTAACALICVFSFFAAGAVDKFVSEDEGEDIPGAADAAQPETYVVKNVEGRVCVFSASQEREPIIVTDIDFDRLRENDKSAILDGIELERFEDVLRLIEDFNS